MSKVFIQEETLSNIGAAIREKTGKTDLIAPGNMPAEIRGIVSGGGEDWTPDAEDLVLIGDCGGAFGNGRFQSYIQKFGHLITTEDITFSDSMFQYCNRLTEIPFNLNYAIPYSNSYLRADNMFDGCKELKTLPKLNNFYAYRTPSMFQDMYSLREFPEDYFDDWNWTYWDNSTSATSTSRGSMFSGCYSLRKFPMEILRHGNPKVKSTTYSPYSSLWINNYSLDELVDIPTPPNADTETSNNMFSSTFYCVSRLKRLTFEPCTINWSGQIIDLTTYVGYSYSLESASPIYSYNSGITVDKEVKDDASYQALKNDPDWFATDIKYSRYNHDSAVETINSLPQSNGGNTIKFYGQSGALTDGGAISNLTEEEIAVAAAKGWTVSLI